MRAWFDFARSSPRGDAPTIPKILAGSIPRVGSAVMYACDLQDSTARVRSWRLRSRGLTALTLGRRVGLFITGERFPKTLGVVGRNLELLRGVLEANGHLIFYDAHFDARDAV